MRNLNLGRNTVSRIIKDIEIEGRPAVALFDTGAFHTYVRRLLLGGVRVIPVARPYKVGLGGEAIEIREVAIAQGKIGGYDFDTEVVPVEELGEADGHRLDAIIGALTMEKWEIRLDPRSGALDLEGLRRREFTEYVVGAALHGRPPRGRARNDGAESSRRGGVLAAR